MSTRPFSFAEFNAWPDRREIVVAEATPSITLSGWQTAGGLSKTYEIALSRKYQTARFPGGVYRRVVDVRENALYLTVRASAAEVDATAGSWYWDEAAGVLYVHSSTDASPDTFSAYQAYVTYYMATAGVVLDRVNGDPATGTYHWPWLAGELPRLSMYMEDPLFGLKVTEGGAIGLTNAHGFFHLAIPDHNWKNKRLRLFLGGSYNGQDLSRPLYVPLTTMLVEDIAANEETARLQLKPLAKLLDRELPITPYFEVSHPNLGEGVRGTKKWIGYGRATVPPDLTDTSSHGVYTVADAAYQTLAAVHSVYAVSKATGVRTTLTEGTHYTTNLTACTITIVTATYRWQDYTLHVDVTGRPEKTFSDIVKDMLLRFVIDTGGKPDGDYLDAAAFAQAKIDAPQELSVWIKRPRSIASILATSEAEQPSLERSVMGTLQNTLDGKWTCWIWQPGVDAATAKRLRKEDFASFNPEPRLEGVFATTRVHFGYDHTRDEWAIEEKTDPVVEYLSETEAPYDVYTFLRSSADAVVLAQRTQYVSGGEPLEVEFSERGAILTQAVAGDRVLVTYDPMPVSGGKALEKVFEILRIDRSLGPVLAISGRLGDLRGIAGLVGRWAAASAPSWAASSAAERDANGFWSDANGSIDPADPATKNQRVWW